MTSPGFAVGKLNLPSISVTAPELVPLITTEAPIRGSPVALSTTEPDT